MMMPNARSAVFVIESGVTNCTVAVAVAVSDKPSAKTAVVATSETRAAASTRFIGFS
jgi:hypothetical protein